MKKLIVVHIGCKGKGDSLGLAMFETVEFVRCFEKARDMGLSDVGAVSIQHSSSFTVKGYKGESAIDEFIEWLNSLGYRASDAISGKAHSEGAFNIIVRDQFDPGDINHNDPLVMQSFSAEGRVELVNREPGTLTGKASGVHMMSGDYGREPWKANALLAEYHWEFAVSGHLKEQLESEEFVGLEFEEIQWCDPENAQGRFWMARSNIKMPPTLTPVAFINGPTAEYDYAETDGGRPARLFYRRAEFERLGAFDFGVTLERLGTRGRPRVAEFRHIISQRFRRYLESQGYQLSLTPLVLID
jgi:hypothetical protein